MRPRNGELTWHAMNLATVMLTRSRGAAEILKTPNSALRGAAAPREHGLPVLLRVPGFAGLVGARLSSVEPTRAGLN
jgi:hypothetical protein